MPVTEPLFALDAGRYVPSEHTRGPWDPRHQHGGPSAALVARAVEAEAGAGFTVSRLTLELLRPVPIEPLSVVAAVTKPGRRVVRVEATVLAHGGGRDGGDGPDGAGAGGGTPVVRATGVAVRHAELDVSGAPDDGRHDVPEPGPDQGRPMAFGAVGELPAFHLTGMDVRIVGGAIDGPGPARAWFRLRRPVVGGEEPTGLQRAAAAADFGNGVSWALPFEQWLFVNPDLTVHLARPPQGEWIALDANTLLSDEGTAMAEATLYDRAGRLGRSVQTLILERRPEDPA